MFEVVGIVVGELHECFFVILFSSLTWFASASIRAIKEDVEFHHVSWHGSSRRKITNWKKNYCLIIKFTEELDCMLGLTLLVLIAKQLIYFVVYSFNILEQMYRNNLSVFSVTLSIRNIILMAVLIAGPQYIKNEVSLRKTPFNPLAVHSTSSGSHRQVVSLTNAVQEMDSSKNKSRWEVIH